VKIEYIIADLRNQLDNINLVILTLEHVSSSRPRRRGRPRTNHSKATGARVKLASPHLAMVAGSSLPVKLADQDKWIGNG
jgi:hypothetical protein